MAMQEVFNIAVALIGFLAAWVLRVLWESIKELQRNNKEVSDQLRDNELLVLGQYTKKEELDRVADAILTKISKLENIEVSIAHHYVGREEFLRATDRIFAKLDKIDNDLNRKADKS